MARKIFTIVVLAAALGLFLYFRPLLFGGNREPRVVDRLPNADFIGRANVLELAQETSAMMYYHKIVYRDFTTPEFLLAQCKTYGLNIQKPTYLFGFEKNNEWGFIVEVSDSSKIRLGLERLGKIVDITEGEFEFNGIKQKIYRYPKEKMYLTYGKNYLFFFKGRKFQEVAEEVIAAQYDGIREPWKRFLRNRKFKDEHLVIGSNWDELKNIGIKTAIFAHDSDSLSFNLKCYLKRTIPFYIQMKQVGWSFSSIDAAEKSVNLHLDISELKKHPLDSLYIKLSQLGKRFGFPFKDFMRAWNGSLSFMEGGLQNVTETYIETELDEDFNPIEVEKTRNVKISGYSLSLGMNNFGEQFLNRLMEKGILRTDGEGFRVLFSPLLNYVRTQNEMLFYSGSQAPRRKFSTDNHITWTVEGTRYLFSIDSIARYEVFGSLHIPVRRIFRRNKLI